MDSATSRLERVLATFGKPASEVTREDVDWVVGAWAAAGIAASTRRTYVQAFKGFHGLTTRVPWRLDQEGRSSHGSEVPYSAELRRRAVAMVVGLRSEYDTEFAAITWVAKQLGIGSAETLRKWVRQPQRVPPGYCLLAQSEEAIRIPVVRRAACARKTNVLRLNRG